MKKTLLFTLAFSTIIVLSSWGAWGHYHINKAAVFALPDSMRPFFYNHIDFITEESVVPDLRKFAIVDKSEAGRHYLDVEGFEKPIDSLMNYSSDYAYAKYDEKFLQKNGFLPWFIQDVMDKLTKAFRDKKRTDILFLSADLGHYLGDAHVPLHTTLNHDGQLTGQKGIHAFWESQLPEMFGEGYNLKTEEAHYLPDVRLATWDIIRSSFALVDSVLKVEKDLGKTFPKDAIYVKDKQGNIFKNKYRQPVHTPEYTRKYHELLRGMVERQMRASIVATSSFWYTAWVNAGRPDLSTLDNVGLTKQNAKNYRKELKTWRRTGKLMNLEPANEF
jgi:hypothetical protein